MSNHTTPGNWQADKLTARALPDGACECRVETRDNHVATCYGETLSEAIDNAKTCAAAPDLLKHCRAMLAQFDKLANDGNLTAARALGLDPFEAMKARAVLAKLPQ